MASRERAKKARLARVIGVSPSAMTAFQHDPTFPPFDKKDEAEVYAVCVWRYLTHEKNPIPTDDSLLTGDDSDGLERYRQARAGLAEIELAIQRGKVIKLENAVPAIEIVLSEIRKLSEHCKRTGNTDLFELIVEANKNVETGLEKLCGLTNSTNADSLGSIRDPVS
jgi:hypothetical protein